MSLAKHLQLGQTAEKAACHFLEKKGFRVLRQNYKALNGEIDLIMEDGEEVVFVEVKSRSRADFGHASLAVTQTKQRHLIRTATVFLQQMGWLYTRYSRFDVVAIHFSQENVQIDWFKNAFPGS